MRAIGVTARRVLQIGQGDLPGRRNLVDNHDKRVAAILGRVPGVEQLLLVMAARRRRTSARRPARRMRGRAASGPTGAARSTMVALTGHRLQLRK